MTRAKRDPNSETFNFSEWNLISEGNFQKMLGVAAISILHEGIKLASKEYECEFDFAAQRAAFNNEPLPSDPTTINVFLPLTSYEHHEDNSDATAWPRWTFTLTDLVNYTIELIKTDTANRTSEDIDRELEAFKKIGDELSTLARRINEEYKQMKKAAR